MQELIQAIQSELQLSEDALKEAKTAAARVQAVEANIVRLKAALTALNAPQTPDGRKRIGAARRKRKEPVAAVPLNGGSSIAAIAECARPSVANLRCSECHKDVPTVNCYAPGCDAQVCGDCLKVHDARWHSEGGAA